ncbi:hypothetical protein DMH26_12535 [Streptomyces sp. WAC 05379]|nr:hypothetical protein DMH26_12535 [Streptomyces sp. WAC 05379]
MAGTQPGQLMSWLNQLLDATVQPALGSAVCCRYRPDTRTLTWRLGGGAVRREMGRHDALRCGDGTTKADGRTVTTVAQPATRCKGFGNTRFGGASGICQSPSGGLVRYERRTSRPGPSRR